MLVDSNHLMMGKSKPLSSGTLRKTSLEMDNIFASY